MFKEKNKLLGASAILFLGMNSGNVFHYFFQFYLSRNLTKADFGTLNSLLSFFAILAMPMTAVMYSFSKKISEKKAEPDKTSLNTLVIKYVVSAVLVSALISGWGLISRGRVSALLHIADMVPVYTIILLISVTLIFYIGIGYFQGKQFFKLMAIVYTLSGFLKLLFVVILIKINLGLRGALFSVFLSTFLLSGYLFRRMLQDLSWKDLFFKKTCGHNSRMIFKGLFAYKEESCIITTYLIFAWLVNADLLFVKHFFVPDSAGLFSAVAVLGRAIFFFPNSIVLALLPLTSERLARKQDAKDLLLKALTYTFFLAGIGVAILFIFPETTLRWLFGKQYISIQYLLGKEGLAMLLFAEVNVLLTCNIALSNYKVMPVILIASLTQFILMVNFSGALENFIKINIFLGIALVTILYYLTINFYRQTPIKI